VKDLRGKVTLLTGAAHGIGAVTARLLATKGMNLALVDRDPDPLADVADECATLGVQAVPIRADVTDAEGRSRVLATTERELGAIDVLVNNAAIIEWVPFVEQDPDQITRTIDTNVTAPLQLARAVLPAMIQRRSGHLVTLASLEGKVGIPHTATYGATKAALLIWNAALRSELDRTGVGVTAIAPGYVTDVGMWAAWGLPAPAMSGPVSPEQVAQAVVRALRDNPQEIIVRSTPTRPLLALAALRPEVAGWLLKAMGIDKQMKSLISNERTTA
jgi:short-subunit dehydrogenase